MYKTTKKLGDATIEVEADTFKELCEAATQVPSLEKCDLCGCTALSPNHRNVKENNFYSILCTGCGAEFKLGQKKVGDRLFYYTDTVFEKWEGNAAAPAAPAATQPQPVAQPVAQPAPAAAPAQPVAQPAPVAPAAAAAQVPF